jgi:hypothetical protein
MALSIDAIHKPLSDFFLTHFKTDAASPVQFRFDQLGSVIADADYIDASEPAAGYSPAKARESFSRLVNNVPIEQPGGLQVFTSLNAIDETYFFRLLSPAVAGIPSGADDRAREAIAHAFEAVKTDAILRWEGAGLESGSGLRLQFKPALATPENWYDKNSRDIWTSVSFRVGDQAPATPPPAPPNIKLWKLRMADTRFQTMLQAVAAAPPAAPAAPVAPAGASPEAHPALFARRMAPVAAGMMAAPAPMGAGGFAAAAGFNVEPHDGVQRRFRDLELVQRVEIKQVLVATQVTKPVATNSISIAFDYCLVKIQRPWLSNLFVTDQTWCIPGTAKGTLTAADPNGAALTLLPMAMVVIKNLTIDANWTAEDVAAAKESTDFGPFRIDKGIVNNKLTHEGLQNIGWLLQRMPELPPKDA